MNNQSDQRLLSEYAKSHSEAAFSSLVSRHVDLVYSAALRMVRDSHLANDVTQGVFIALAQNAEKVSDHPVLSGWLHRTTQNIASNVVRSEVRRRTREEEAMAMNDVLSTSDEAPWEEIAPQLDSALGDLNETDRDALLLRYFERKSAREIAEALGISDEAAQKRVNRAIERLRVLFTKRGLNVGGVALAAAISTSAVQAAPIGISLTICSHAIGSGVILHTTALTATKALVMTTLQKAVIATLVAIGIAVPLIVQTQTERLRKDNDALRAQVEQVRQLQTDNDRLTTLLDNQKSQASQSSAEMEELLQLRARANQPQAAARDLNAFKNNLALLGPGGMDVITNGFANGLSIANKRKEKAALEKLARMKARLKLMATQEEEIKKHQMEKIRLHSQYVMEALTGKLSEEQKRAYATMEDDLEAKIRSTLTPEQLAAFPEFESEEKRRTAKSTASFEASTLTKEFKLPPEVKDQIYNALYQHALNKSPKPSFLTGSANDVALNLERETQELSDRLKTLEGILTPDQIKLYQQEKLSTLDMTAQMMKAFFPVKTTATKQ